MNKAFTIKHIWRLLTDRNFLWTVCSSPSTFLIRLFLMPFLKQTLIGLVKNSQACQRIFRRDYVANRRGEHAFFDGCMSHTPQVIELMPDYLIL